MMHAVERQLQPVSHLQFVVNLAQVIFHHLLGGAHLTRDVFVFHPLRDPADDEHFLFAETQLLLGGGALQGLSAIGLDYPIDPLLVEPGFSGSNFADTADQQIG